MSLSVIGAGMGRTGTLSLKFALEALGFAPCYHMLEVIENPDHVPLWQAALRGEADDWEALFGRYRATVDWPACYYWRELCDRYPDAKVLLTVRDPERWYESMRQTIFEVLHRAADPTVALPPGQVGVAVEVVARRTFADRLDDKAFVIGVYEAHIAAVKAALPAERLLVLDVAEGWAPLCGFLGCPVPDAPFPRVNDTAEFKARAGT